MPNRITKLWEQHVNETKGFVAFFKAKNADETIKTPSFWQVF